MSKLRLGIGNFLIYGRASPIGERCPGGDNQHSVPLHWAQKVSIHGLIW